MPHFTPEDLQVLEELYGDERFKIAISRKFDDIAAELRRLWEMEKQIKCNHKAWSAGAISRCLNCGKV